MMQGDSYSLEFEILNADGSVVAASNVSDVEISVGFLKKRYSAGEITFSEDKKWLFPLAQEETFAMAPARAKVQVRVKRASGVVEGCDLGYRNIRESISKEVL